MKKINPKDLKIIRGVPPFLTKEARCSIDTEWFGMDKNRLHRPHGIFACATFCFDGKTVYVVTDVDDLQEAFDNIDSAVHVYVNAKFDVNQLRKYINIPVRSRLWDCFLIEQIMFSGYYNDFALNDLARRYLDIYLSKDVRAEFSQKNAPEPSGSDLEASYTLSQEMLEYACIDTVATWLVYQEQRARIDENDLNIWREIELPFMWTILEMGGVLLDTESWLKLAKENRDKADAIQAKYGHSETIIGKRGGKKEQFVGLNLNSPLQVKKYFAECGVKLESSDAEALEKIVAIGDGHDAACIFAADMLEYRKYAKRASTYGEKFITDYVEQDGRIYGDIYQMGAETGRTSSRHPNLQNQPHETEYRSCFIAEDGNCMIVADWGSQEPRFAALFSQDERLIEILNSGKKLYIEICRDVFGKEVSKEDEEYKHVKSTVLGIFYGMTAQGLAIRLGVSEKDAQGMIDKILETYPGIQEYIERQKKAGDYVESVCGRKIWLNKYSNQWERNALNAPIQGSAADAMKLAAARFLQEWRDVGDYHNQAPLRLLVHDEIVVECEEESVEKMKQVLEHAMISVAEELHDGIKGAIDIFSGPNWGIKH